MLQRLSKLTVFFCLVSFKTFASDSRLSPYHDLIEKLASKTITLPIKDLITDVNRQSVELIPIISPADLFYIGAEQRMLIHASLEQVARTLSKVENYNQFFPDIGSSKVFKKTDTEWEIQLEQKVPSVLIPNEFFSLHYDLRSKPKEWNLYVYRLIKGQSLIFSDGFVFLKAISPRETFLLEVDYWKASMLIGASILKKYIWRSSLRGFAVSNLAFRRVAEASSPPPLTEIKAYVEPLINQMDFRHILDDTKIQESDWENSFPKILK